MKRIFLATLAVAWVSAAWAGGPAPENLTWGDHGELASPLTSVPGDAARGRIIVAGKSRGNCIACHSAADLEEFPFHGNIGPLLDGAGDRWTEAGLRGLVADAKRTFEGTVMPSFYKNSGYIRPGDGYTGKAPKGPLTTILTAQEIEDVVAYLMTLKET